MNFYQRDKSISEPSKPLNQRVREGLLWGGLGNFVQQFVSLLLGIALSRILNPDDYGMTAMLTLFSLLAATIQESGFGTALANRKVILFKEYNSVFWFSACLSISLYLLLYFLAPRIASFYATPDLVPLSRYMFLGFLIGGLGVAPNAYLFRQQQVRERSLASSIAVIFSGLVGVLLAFLGFGYWSLASQYIVYSAVVTLMLWYFFWF